MHPDFEYMVDCLSRFFTEALPCLSECYSWPTPFKVPFEGYREQGGSRLEQSLNLRRFLCGRWQTASEDERLRIARWYIRDWGHIYRNSEDRIKEYARAVPSDLIARGQTGIASWSKVLAIRDAESFAIYDSRVATSLNALQIVYGGQLKLLFDQLPSRNRKIREFWDSLKNTAALKNSRRVDATDTYRAYLGLLKSEPLKRHGRRHWHEYEMALFSHAERLVEKAREGSRSGQSS